MFTVTTISTTPIYVAIRSAQGTYWNFSTQVYGSFDSTNSVSIMQVDSTFSTLLYLNPSEVPFQTEGASIILLKKLNGTYEPVDVTSSYGPIDGVMPVKAVISGQFGSVTLR